MRKKLIFLSLLMLISMLSACGQPGKLYLPNQKNPNYEPRN